MVAIVVIAVTTLTGGKPAPAALAAKQEQTTPSVAARPQAPDPASAAQQYLQAFAIGDATTASTFTDDPSDAAAALNDAWQTLRPTEIQTKVGTVGPATGTTASVKVTMAWTLAAGHTWSYDDTFDVVRTGRTWLVHWTPAVLHPSLRTGERLTVLDTTPDQVGAVDRDGKPLVMTGPGGSRLADQTTFGLLRSALVGQVKPAGPIFAVERVDSDGHALQTLFGHTTGVTVLKSTLSSTVEAAAQSVVNGYSGKASIVAIQPSNGGLLAVAQNAQGGGSSPFSGLYAPGSTFKIVTATAALESGTASPDSSLACPLTARIGTRTISNEGFDLGTTTMHRAFARSCNTTFGQLAADLHPSQLVTAATQYGLNADFDIPGLATQTGKVVPATSSDELVEDGIGQGTVQVSPFGEALMAATVEAGHAVTPRLWRNVGTHVDTGYTGPSASALAALRPMMREVVTDGTATGLAHSGSVYGKTGTAQFGSGDDANGWFVGYRGDLAFAVFLEDANSSTPAVALAAKFLAALG
jgi:hypothetical protein